MQSPSHWTFPCGSAGKESACNVGDLGSILGLGRSPGEGERLLSPVFWPGEFHGLYSPWSRKESDKTERLSLSLQPLDHQGSLKTLTLLFTASSRGSRLSPIFSTQPTARCESHSHILSFRHRTLPTNGYSLGYQLSPELCSLKQ